jgi:hypothetical protein
MVCRHTRMIPTDVQSIGTAYDYHTITSSECSCIEDRFRLRTASDAALVLQQHITHCVSVITVSSRVSAALSTPALLV